MFVFIKYFCAFTLFFAALSHSEETTTNATTPVEDIHVTSRFLAPGHQLDPQLKICTLSNGLPVACATLEVCVQHGALSQNIILDVEYTLDPDSPIPRIYFLQPEGMFVERQIWPLDGTNTGACVQRLVFLRDDAEDKFSPLSAEVKFSVQPTLNQSNSFMKFSRDELNITRNCGEDDYCEPNLKLDVVPNIPTYVIGSYQLVELGISVANTGEDAFQTFLNITLPEDVAFVNVKMVTDPPVICYLGNDSAWLSCDIGNPLRTGEAVQFVTVFQPIVMDGIAKHLDFSLCLNSSAPSKKQKISEDHAEVSIAVDVSTKLRLEATSFPDEVTYKKSEYKDEIKYISDVGPQLLHKYAIINEGLIGIEELDIRVIVLNATLNDEILIYPTRQAETSGANVTCESIPVNPKEYKETDEEESEVPPEEEEAKSRKRRQIALFQTNIDMIEGGILAQCKENKCTSLKCKVRYLESQEGASITLESRINVRALKEPSPVTVGTILLAEITKLPFVERPGHLEIYSKQISTDIVPEE